MKGFLSHVAIELLERYPKIHRVGVLIPSKRAERVLRQTLLEEINSPTLAPAIFTIEEIMADISGLKIANAMDQLIILFETYEKLNEGFSESLDEFLKWAPVVLKDFDEIARFGVNGEKIFSEVREIQALSQWGIDEPTDLMKRRLILWQQLPVLYRSFNEALEEENLGSPGYIFNKASPSFSGPSKQDLKDWMLRNELDHIAFVGFNALTPPEISLFQTAHSQVKAIAFWDTDAHYVNNESIEAGYYLRKNIEKLSKSLVSDILTPPAYFLTSPPSFTVVHANGNVGISKAIGNILNDEKLIASNFNKCAVVLTDEGLLVPTLQALPPKLKEANVTMGMALSTTALYSGIDLFFQLQEAREIGSTYPFKLLEATFANPICRDLRNGGLSEENENSMENQIASLRNSKQSHWSVSNTLELIGENSQLWQECSESTLYLKSMLERLEKYTGTLHSPWEKEPARLCLKALGRLVSWKSKRELKFRTIRQLFRQFSKESPVNFYGEPFHGLQIMGLLETRNLDFETIIIAPCNEGVLPARKKSTSFLPNDLRNKYDIPLGKDQEAIIAYHTYRLVQRAKKVFFLVNSASDGFNSSEVSRFIQQMEIELSQYPGFKWSNMNMELTMNSSTLIEKRSIIKRPKIIKRTLERLQGKGLSPSAAGTYIGNPYKFYLQYVLGIRAEESVNDRLPANIRGTILHDLHQKLYETYKSTKTWDQSIIKKTLDKSISLHFPSKVQTGPFLLERKIIEKISYEWAKEEEKRIKSPNNRQGNWSIHLIEEYLESPLLLSDGRNIRIRGKADRVEKWDDYWVIVDLKTGAFQKDQINLKEWEDLLDRKKKKEKAFQLMTYAWLLGKQEDLKSAKGFKAGIASIRQPTQPVSWLTWQGKESLSHQELKEFEKYVLIPLVEEILNPDISFLEILDA
ncbi:MAG: Uncharacterised protein [Owenweeksia sp. TMED14]|nr:MAG: Uncharacterised protein [Owenweeksia sp. TMED14]